MTDFIIKKLPYDLTSNAGLALVGQYFKRLGINQRIDYPSLPSLAKAFPTATSSKATSVSRVRHQNPNFVRFAPSRPIESTA